MSSTRWIALFFFAANAGAASTLDDCRDHVAIEAALVGATPKTVSFPPFLERLAALDGGFRARNDARDFSEGAPTATNVMAQGRSPETPEFPLLVRLDTPPGAPERWIAESPRAHTRRRLDDLRGFFAENPPNVWVEDGRKLFEVSLDGFEQDDAPLLVPETLPDGTVTRETLRGRVAGVVCAVPVGLVTAALGIGVTVGCAFVLPPLAREVVAWLGALATSAGGVLSGYATFQSMMTLLRKNVAATAVDDAAIPMLRYLLANGGERVAGQAYFFSLGESPRLDVLVDGSQKRAWGYRWEGR